MHVNLRWLGCFLFLVGLIGWLIYPLVQIRFLTFLANYLSADHHITVGGAQQVLALVHFAGLTLCLAGVALWCLQNQAGWNRLRQALVEQPPVGAAPFYARSPFIAAASFSAGVFLILNIHLWEANRPVFSALYHEDGLFETLTVVMLLAASVFLALTLRHYRQPVYRRDVPRYVLAIYLGLALAFIFLAGEEISWGQRLLGWTTPAWLAIHNTQNETNLHNLFTGYFGAAYSILALTPLSVVGAVILKYLGRLSKWTVFILPPPSLLGISWLIAAVAVIQPTEQELLEEMLALFIFFYALWIYGGSHPLGKRALSLA